MRTRAELGDVVDAALTRAVHAPFAAALAPSALHFARALRDPRRAQAAALARIACEVPRIARAGVRTLDDLRARLPLTDYDDIRADIDAVAAGGNGNDAARAFTRAHVERFELSGGSAGAQKLIPQTRPFLDEMNRALQPWLFSLSTMSPGVAAGCAYWSISPLGTKRGRTAGGIAIGSDDDASYFPAPLRALLSRVLAVPSTLATIGDVDACRYATLRLLLQRDDLAFISVWSPTFLTLLMQALDANLASLVDDLARGTLTHPRIERSVAASLPLRAMRERAAAVAAAADGAARERRPVHGHELWPRLALLSMWTDGAAAGFVDGARARFPLTPVQPKGLLATEGVTSIPWPGAPAPVLAVRSHVLELLDESRGHAPRFAHEVELGGVYEVVLTTSAGLTRYRTFDRVEVVGRVHATPCVRFLGRANIVSDLVGEKLAAAFVGSVLSATVPRASFAMLAPATAATAATAAPTAAAPHYRVYLEDRERSAREVAREVEARLSEGHPYRYARALGQLGAVDVMVCNDATRAYESACVARGQRAGDIKPTPLSLRADWDTVFNGRVVDGGDRDVR